MVQTQSGSPTDGNTPEVKGKYALQPDIDRNRVSEVASTTSKPTPGQPTQTSKRLRRESQPQQDSQVAQPSKRPRQWVPPGVVFLELNSDVLFHITSHSHPAALVNLARTCKFLREFLMTRSSIFVWRNARRQLEGLPACPFDLSEQKYAHLLFDDHCHNCGEHWQSSEQMVYWNVRWRLCHKCIDIRLVTSDRSLGIIPTDWVSCVSHFACDKIQHTMFWDSYNEVSDKECFKKEFREKRCIVKKHATECNAWLNEQLYRREESILERLRQLGYNDEVRFARQHIVSHLKSTFRITWALTDKEWDQMRPRWLEIMPNIRALRLREEAFRLREVVYPSRQRCLVDEYDAYVTTPGWYPPSGMLTLDILPHILDIASFPPFDAIIKVPEVASPQCILFLSTFMHLPVCVAEWRVKLNEAITAIANHPHPAPQGGSSQNNSTCGLFHWRDPGGLRGDILLSYPDVLFLDAFQRYQPQDTGSPGLPEHLSPRVDTHGEPLLRKCGEVEHVIRACGFDLKVTSFEDMEDRNARFVCLMCPSSQIVRTWIGAVCHSELHHPGVQFNDKVLRWRLIDDDHIELIEAIENSGGLGPLRAPYFRCLLCWPRVGDARSRPELLDHLRDKHGITKKKAFRGEHYVPLRCVSVCFGARSLVEMLEEEGSVTFRVAAFDEEEDA